MDGTAPSDRKADGPEGDTAEKLSAIGKIFREREPVAEERETAIQIPLGLVVRVGRELGGEATPTA
jgi:hypothetical protein